MTRDRVMQEVAAVADDPKPVDDNIADRGPRKRWSPEADAETAAVLRLLAVRPWLVADRDAEAIAAVRRNLSAVRDALARLGWVLVVERDLVRLRKSPPVRRAAWAAGGPPPLQASWFFLLVAASESMAPRVGLAQLVTAAHAAAAEIGLPVTGHITQRRAIVHALDMLDERGVVEQVDGDADGFLTDDDPPVLLAVHHTRLAHVIANFGTIDPAADPAAWLQQVEREPDPARRMRRRLIDDAVVYVTDLDEAEADWLSRRVRGDDGAPLAKAFGLHLERRAEGAAFIVPADAFRHLRELGPLPFYAPGTVPHAALLLCDYAATHGMLGSADITTSARHGPGPGWRGLLEAEVIAHLGAVAASQPEGRGGWSRELADDPTRLADQVHGLLAGLDLLRVKSDPGGRAWWWFSPATGRWTAPGVPLRPGDPTHLSDSANSTRGSRTPSSPTAVDEVTVSTTDITTEVATRGAAATHPTWRHE